MALGVLDNEKVKGGDGRILGFRSSPQPTELPPGIASRLENMRLDGLTARVRKGPKAVATDLVLSNPAVALSFQLGVMRDAVSLTRTGTTARFVFAGAVSLTVGQFVKVRNADQTEYNGTVEITATGTDGSNFYFEYDVDGAAVTPATGAIRFGTGPRIFNTYADKIHVTGNFASDSNTEALMLAATNKAFVYREGMSLATIDYPSGETVEAADDCTIRQYLGQVFLCRGRNKDVLRWDRDFTNDFVVVDQSTPPSGKVRFPRTGWIVEFNRRLLAERSRDELIPSDFGEYDEWTPQEVLRFVPGGADWLIGAHTIHLTSHLALYRYSVHQAFYNVTDLFPAGTRLVTGAPGCRARATVKTCGSNVLYLSDMGVHALEITSELNVRAQSQPLSRYIKDYIDRINWDYAHLAVAEYHDNRYYLAVPLDGATVNNTLLTFNFLLSINPDSPLGEWESVDRFVEGFDIRGLHVIKYDGQARLHATTSYGYVFPLEVGDVDEFGGPGSNGVQAYQIPGLLLTRQDYAGDESVKQWTKAHIEANPQIGDAYKIECVTRNPDSVKVIYTHTSLRATDKSHRPKIRCQRGVAAGLRITTSQGRPEFRAWQVEGVSADASNRTRE